MASLHRLLVKGSVLWIQLIARGCIYVCLTAQFFGPIGCYKVVYPRDPWHAYLPKHNQNIQHFCFPVTNGLVSVVG